MEETLIVSSGTTNVADILIATNLKEVDNLRSTQAKMDAVREDNERLKQTLSRIMKEYHSLKMHFQAIAQKDEANKTSVLESPAADDPELVSLSLGRSSPGVDYEKREEEKINNKEKKREDEGKLDGLELGLDCKFHLGSNETESPSPANSADDDQSKEDNHNSTWSPTKSLKTERSGDDEILQQNPVKKPRVSIRATCDSQTMNDGCQWRKYGQKVAKGNPCPRAYYRCTVSSNCPVRKQVQRCVEDMFVLITTYEGTHNHSLSVSAKAMASATSAAAAMLKSGSSTSQPGLELSATSSTSTNLQGFNFNPTNSTYRPLNFPRASIVTSQSHPTIVLDLTTHNNAPPYGTKLPSTLFSATQSYSKCLNFSSTPSSSSLESNTSSLNVPWNTDFLSRSGALFNSINHVGASFNSQPYVNNNVQISSDKIAAATKALASNPTFQSALAEAVTSFVRNSGSNIQENIQGSGGNSEQNFHLYFPQQSMKDGIGCATSYVNKLPQPLISQQKNLTSLPSLTFSSSKATPMALCEEGEHI